MKLGRKRISVVALVIALAGSGCLISLSAAGASQVSHAKYVIKFALAGGLPSPQDVAAVSFQKMVEKQSRGQIQVQLYFNNVLAPQNYVTAAVGSDVAQMDSVTANNLGEYVPEWNVLQTPFIFTDTAQLVKGLDSKYMRNLEVEFEQKSGIRDLAWEEGGWVEYISKAGFLTKPSDFRGLKIRVVPGDPTVSGVETQLGAEPVPIELAEVFTGEQAGTVNTTDEPISSFYTDKDYENLPYITLGINFQALPGVWQINNKFYLSLPKSLQKVVLNAAIAGANKSAAITSARNNFYEKQMAKAGAKEYTLTPKQRASIVKAAVPYLRTLPKTYGSEIFKVFGVNFNKL